MLINVVLCCETINLLSTQNYFELPRTFDIFWALEVVPMIADQDTHSFSLFRVFLFTLELFLRRVAGQTNWFTTDPAKSDDHNSFGTIPVPDTDAICACKNVFLFVLNSGFRRLTVYQAKHLKSPLLEWGHEYVLHVGSTRVGWFSLNYSCVLRQVYKRKWEEKWSHMVNFFPRNVLHNGSVYISYFILATQLE